MERLTDDHGISMSLQIHVRQGASIESLVDGVRLLREKARVLWPDSPCSTDTFEDPNGAGYWIEVNAYQQYEEDED